MAITIQKRTRPTVNDPWSAWADTTDAAPYIDTDTVDYRVKSEILVEEVTNATTVDNGTGIFDILMRAMNIHVNDQYTKGRLTGPDYANVYLGAMQLAMTQGIQWSKQEEILANQIRKSEAEADMAENDAEEKDEKWDLQKQILEDQVFMSDIDKTYKSDMVTKDLSLKDEQIATMKADSAFNESKKDIMIATRKDNIRMKSAEQFAEFLKYISAANVVPGPTDFTNMRNLITGINEGITNDDHKTTLTDTTTNYVSV
jgi:hypothetical protein